MSWDPEFWPRFLAAGLAGLIVWLPIIWWNNRQAYRRGCEDQRREHQKELETIRRNLDQALYQQGEILKRVKP